LTISAAEPQSILLTLFPQRNRKSNFRYFTSLLSVSSRWHLPWFRGEYM